MYVGYMYICMFWMEPPVAIWAPTGVSIADWLEPLPEWEQALLQGDASGSDDEPDLDAVTGDVATNELFNHIVHLKWSGLLSAKNACVLAWWSSKAGAGTRGSQLEKLGKKPGDPSTGNYSKHFDVVTGVDVGRGSEGFYYVDTPCHLRSEVLRTSQRTPAVLPIDVISEELALVPELHAKYDAAIGERTLPPAYFEHPVVAAAAEQGEGDKVWPAAIYIDGVSFARRETCLGFWFYNVLSGQRSLLAALRKSEVCHCGCRGYDTVFCILTFLHWQLKALAEGVHPRFRHDGSEWCPSTEAKCHALAGHRLGFRVAVVFLKADWGEFATNLAFPSWQDAMHPCPFCWATLEDWCNPRGVSVLGMPKARKTLEQYLEACAACELWVDVDDHAYATLRAALEYQKGKAGCRGRGLKVDVLVGGVQLLKGDRLEPHAGMMDVAAFDRKARPFRALFWRRSRETLTRRRNPLFANDIGLSPWATMAVDWQHCLSLGVFKTWASLAVHSLINVNAWNVPGAKAERLTGSATIIRRLLFQWYSDEHKRGISHSRVGDLTDGMLGDNESAALGLHAAETNSFVKFVVPVLLPRYGTRLPNSAWQLLCRSGAPLVTMMRLHTEFGHGLMPPAAAQEYVEAVCEHLNCCAALGARSMPKHHMMMELAARLLWFGAPSAYGCWEDESLNGVLKPIAARAHRLVWGRRVLAEWGRSAGLQRKRRIE